ncbi:hypothetical protein [Bartonella henselae]|uniref:Hypothetical membrane protein n=1 Tax=Bartonella henselae TaxID=38323 RepID=X5M465_BARHN|nr:hypothetical protein [Bartonella henselae]MDM9997213.1 hypothetical protein [Bartonella henselae]OLL49286.1 hypothetical protein AT243_04050 [Bartonella henselae]OLL49450.1 hypothetical protein AT247_00820 [Bartonella henselae]OLL50981.1 hypothetical protein AT241_06925 [Bartonella henselae]UJM43379.1 hypothetical protein KAE73_00845 [Bartonella henselae]
MNYLSAKKISYLLIIVISGLFLSDYANSELSIHYQSANIDQSLYERIKVLQKQYKAEQHPKKILSDSGINQYNISFSTVSDYEKPQRRITFDDLIIVIEVLVFISIMSIIINLLWRFKLKIPAYFFLLTTALISGAVLLLLIFD